MASNKRLNATITIGGAITGALRNAFGTTSRSLTDIGKSVRSLSREQRTLAQGISTFGRMGKNVDGLRQKYASVTKELERMRRAQERIQNLENKRQANLSRRAELRGQMLDTAALALAIAAPVKAAIDFESSMADVKKVVDFDTPEQFRQMGDDIIRMSTVLPMAAADIAQIVAAGGQSGLAVGELTKFAESAVKMGVAFNMTAEEAGQMMAEMRAAFKMSQDEVNTLADKMNLLANTTAASEIKIANVVSRVGPLGEVAGVASGEIAALGATLVGIGVQEEVAATGIQNFMLALVAGEAATKAQSAAFAKLGLDSKELAKGMQKDAQGTIMTVLNAVKKLPDYEQASILQRIFGKESIKAIAPLLNVTEQLEENLAKVNDETRYAGAVSKEYAARAATTANNIQLFKNRIASLSITIGDVLLPAINETLGALGPIISKVTEFARENPKLTKTIMAVTAGLIGLKVANLAFGYGLTFVKGAIIAVGRAMLTNPIMAGAAAIAGAAYLIYENWGPIKEWFAGLWDSVKEKTAASWEWFKEKFSWHPVAIIAENWEPLKGFFVSLWDDIMGTVSNAISWITDKIDWVGEKWRQTKEFFGFSGGEDASGTGKSVMDGYVPPPPPMASGGGGAYTDNSQTTIQVTQQPGENSDQLARRLMEEMERRRKVQARGFAFDGVN